MPPWANTHARSDPGRVAQWQYCTDCTGGDGSTIPEEAWRLSYEFYVASRLPIVSMWILVSLNLMAWMIHGNPMASRSYDPHFFIGYYMRALDLWRTLAVAKAERVTDDWEQQLLIERSNNINSLKNVLCSGAHVLKSLRSLAHLS